MINHRNNQFQIQYFYCEAIQEEEKASSMETIANWGIRIRILKPVLPSGGVSGSGYLGGIIELNENKAQKIQY